MVPAFFVCADFPSSIFIRTLFYRNPHTLRFNGSLSRNTLVSCNSSSISPTRHFDGVWFLPIPCHFLFPKQETAYRASHCRYFKPNAASLPHPSLHSVFVPHQIATEFAYRIYFLFLYARAYHHMVTYQQELKIFAAQNFSGQVFYENSCFRGYGATTLRSYLFSLSKTKKI